MSEQPADKKPEIPDIAADIKALEETLLSLSVEEKKTLKHCIMTDETPPDNIKGYAEVVRAALLVKEAREPIAKALDAPQVFLYDPTKPPPPPDDVAWFSQTHLTLFRLIGKDIKARVREAIRDKSKAEQLTRDDSFVWGGMLSILTFTENHIDELAEIFQVTPEELQTLKEQVKAEGKKIPIPVEDKSGYLPGFEPPEEKPDRYPAPPFVYNPYTLIPLAKLSRTMFQQQFTPGLDTPQGCKFSVDQCPHEHYVYMLMLDKLGEQYPITANDKNILIALGNLYGERKEQGRTGIQGGSIITAEDIIRRFRGYDAEATIERSAIDTVTRRMEYLSKLRVSFDFTQHFSYRKKDLGDGEEVELEIPDDMRRIDPKTGTVIRFSYIGNMVHSNTIEVEYASGRIERAWEILTPPIVFDYAQKIKQIATVETKLLDLRKRANGSRDADVMKVYLIERIKAMIDPKTGKPKQDFSHTIDLEKLFFELRIDVFNRVTKKNKVDTIKAILTHFKEERNEKTGKRFIAGFKENKGYRGAVTGFEILF